MLLTVLELLLLIVAVGDASGRRPFHRFRWDVCRLNRCRELCAGFKAWVCQVRLVSFVVGLQSPGPCFEQFLDFITRHLS